MIIDKHPLPDDPMPAEAPPSYDALGASSSSQGYPSGKSPGPQEPIAGPSHSGAHSAPPSPFQPLKSPPLSEPPTPSTSSADKGKARAMPWLKFSESPQARKARELRTIVLGLVRDLIATHPAPAPAAPGILQSCADACAADGVALASVLQEASIEGRTPLYWAVVKRLPDARAEDDPATAAGELDLLSALLAHAAPLAPAAVADLREACRATSDQALFARLRHTPGFAPPSRVDRVLLGVELPPDLVDVAERPGGAGAFSARFVVPHFAKRMAVGREVELEFIARARMWSLTFFVAPERAPGKNQPQGSQPAPGAWCIRLALGAGSPPTYVDAQLTIAPAARPMSSAPSSPTKTRAKVKETEKEKEDGALCIRLATREQLQAASGSSGGRSIVHALSTPAAGASLQYGNSAYIGPDETLRGRLERPAEGADCVIC